MGTIVTEISFIPKYERSCLPISVDFTNAVLVRTLQKPSMNESGGSGPVDKERGANLELPKVALSQPRKHGAFLPFHPQLIILLQLLSLCLAIECGDQGIVIIRSAQGVRFWEIEAEVEVTKEKEVRGIVDGSRCS